MKGFGFPTGGKYDAPFRADTSKKKSELIYLLQKS